MTEHRDHHADLSPSGRARRDALRAELSAIVPRAAAARRRRRAARRAGLSLAAAALAIAFVGWLTSAPPPARTPRGPMAQAPAEQAVPRPSGVTIVRTNPADASAATVRTEALVARCAIGDDDLLLRLAQVGRPAGLIRIDGEARIVALTDRPVVDDPGDDRPG